MVGPVAVVLDNAHGVRKHLRSTLPEFGVAEWNKLSTNSSEPSIRIRARQHQGLPTRDAIEQLATLRDEAQHVLATAAVVQNAELEQKKKERDASLVRILVGSGNAIMDGKEEGKGERSFLVSPEVSERLERLQVLRARAEKLVNRERTSDSIIA